MAALTLGTTETRTRVRGRRHCRQASVSSDTLARIADRTRTSIRYVDRLARPITGPIASRPAGGYREVLTDRLTKRGSLLATPASDLSRAGGRITSREVTDAEVGPVGHVVLCTPPAPLFDAEHRTIGYTLERSFCITDGSKRTNFFFNVW